MSLRQTPGADRICAANAERSSLKTTTTGSFAMKAARCRRCARSSRGRGVLRRHLLEVHAVSAAIGFIVAPDWAMSTLTAAKKLLGLALPDADSKCVAGFIAEGHLTRMSAKCVTSTSSAVNCCWSRCGRNLPVAACHSVVLRHALAALADPGVDLEAVAHALLQQPSQDSPLSRYFLGPQTSGTGVWLRHSRSAGNSAAGFPCCAKPCG